MQQREDCIASTMWQTNSFCFQVLRLEQLRCTLAAGTANKSNVQDFRLARLFKEVGGLVIWKDTAYQFAIWVFFGHKSYAAIVEQEAAVPQLS